MLIQKPFVLTTHKKNIYMIPTYYIKHVAVTLITFCKVILWLIGKLVKIVKYPSENQFLTDFESRFSSRLYVFVM